MTVSLGYLFAATLVVGAVLCSICVWAPRRAVIKSAALVMACLFVPLSYASMTELMSKPKPVNLEWFQGQADRATVLASTMEEGKGIYLWLQLGSTPEPRAYVLPWSRELAEQLQSATREAQSSQGGVGMHMPFESTLDDREPKFYALPQPAMPPKDLLNPPAAERYARPGVNA